ncbi:hypothetical protein F4802DRAFT_602669 [Xylaria palmicola]|nr:hypothetical protein F4802DRAFT_602669 [Xylaria palmicola]
MCLHVYLHHTSEEHDERFASVLNPATGYTVLSPFQQPSRNPCRSPCIKGPRRAFYQPCPWHGGCCDLSEHEVCRHGIGGGSCGTRVSYHYFMSEADPSFDPGMLLQAYLADDDTFLPLVVRLFKAGAEFHLAMGKIQELQTSHNQLHALNLSDHLAAVKKASIASRFNHYQYIKLITAAYLAQIAIHWDAKAAQGAWPQRPGREARPEANKYNPSDFYLETVSRGKADVDPRRPWPHLFKQWPNFQALLPPDESPDSLPWRPDSKTGSFRVVTDVTWTFGANAADTQFSEASAFAMNATMLGFAEPGHAGPRLHDATRQGQHRDRGLGHDQRQGSHHGQQGCSAGRINSPESTSSIELPGQTRGQGTWGRGSKRRDRQSTPEPGPQASCLQRESSGPRPNKRVRFADDPRTDARPLDSKVGAGVSPSALHGPRALVLNTPGSPLTKRRREVEDTGAEGKSDFCTQNPLSPRTPPSSRASSVDRQSPASATFSPVFGLSSPSEASVDSRRKTEANVRRWMDTVMS